ncbi:MAG: hypothetical protein K0R15_2180 [Clostridiales bacterium]|jgi:flagellar operon protein (TIGR03826 family)|nr:hypothetical protein [Clostridiales bacterium]
MDVRNCKNCGRIFNFVGGMGICPICTKEVEDKFQDVKKYIRETPKASLTQISEDNEVSLSIIRKWIKEERLIFTADSLVGIECESCGTMIRTGKYCERCKQEIANTMGNAYQKPQVEPEKPVFKTSTENRMRFLDKDRINQRN